MAVFTDIIISADSRKETTVSSLIFSYNQENDAAGSRPYKFARMYFPAVVKYKI
jgi:hypothetical protein